MNIFPQKLWLSDKNAQIKTSFIRTKSMNKCINHNISIDKYCEKRLIIVLEAACGNRLKCILEYEKFNYDLWTVPFIDFVFERKLPFYLYMCYGPNLPIKNWQQWTNSAFLAAVSSPACLPPPDILINTISKKFGTKSKSWANFIYPKLRDKVVIKEDNKT